ncbi:MAG: hypothetical protein K0S56_1662 [Microvirga sp.]|jgi:hypothetical protein|nr:hypothetical protein [Microvirga sp.]
MLYAAALLWVEREMRDGALKGRPVVFVPGNHEFYGTEVLSCLRKGQKLASRRGIDLLAPGVAVFSGIRVIGATLWRDYALLEHPPSGKVAAFHS